MNTSYNYSDFIGLNLEAPEDQDSLFDRHDDSAGKTRTNKKNTNCNKDKPGQDKQGQ